MRFPHPTFTASQVLGLTLIMVLLSSCQVSSALDRPNGVARAANGSLYVMDFGNKRVVQTSPDGKVTSSFGSFGTNAEQIYSGWDIAIGPDGNIAFCNIVLREDTVVGHSIKIFSPEGRFLHEVGMHSYGEGESEETKTPYGLDIDNQGRIYVAYYGSNSIAVYSPTNEVLATFNSEDFNDLPLDGLNDIAVDDVNNYVYVTSFSLSLVEQFVRTIDADGSIRLTHRLTIGGFGRGPGQLAFPQHLAVNDSTGLLYVGDLGNRRVHVFNAEGEYVSHFAPPDVDDWQVMGIMVDPDGAIYAADALNGVVWVFEPDGRVRTRIGEQQ